ncbi:MAG: Maf family protein [Dehalococcoidia bacterium]
MTRRLVLGSASPRRRERLAARGLAFTVQAPDVDEQPDGSAPAALAETLALRKARAVVAAETEGGDAAVLGADTIVVLDGELLGKPAGATQAAAMLRALRGREHQVVTGVAVVAGERSAVEHVVSRVAMREYSEAQVAAYVAAGSSLDKAGAYAIQDRDFAPVARLDGCECSVIGLPLWTVARLLRAVATIEAQRPSYERCAACPEREG